MCCLIQDEEVAVIDIEKFLPIADRLFIEIVDNFCLVYCEKTKHYILKDLFHAKCHILELCLIPDGNFSGKKFHDIASRLNVNYKWIYGFYVGYRKEAPLFKNKDFLQGYEKATQIRQQNLAIA